MGDAEDVARGRYVRTGVLRAGRRGPMSDAAALEIALRLKALADPARVKLVSFLFSSDAGEVCSSATWPRCSG